MTFLNRRVIIMTFIYILILSGVVWFGIKPLMGSVQSKVADFKSSQQLVSDTQNKKDLLTKLAQSQSSIDQAKDVTAKAIPATIDQDRLILTLEKLATDNGLKVTTLTVAPLTASAAAKSSTTTKTGSSAASNVTISLDVTGSYDNVKKTLDTIELLDRLFTVSSVNFVNAAATTDLTCTIVLISYAKSNTL